MRDRGPFVPEQILMPERRIGSAKLTRNGRVRNYEEGLRVPVARFCSHRGIGIEPYSPALRLLIVRGQFRTDVVNFDHTDPGAVIKSGKEGRI